MRPNVFKATMTTQALLWGNGRAYIRRQAGRPVELIPLRPDATAAFLVMGEKFHVTCPDKDDRLTLFESINSQTNPERYVILPDSDVFHVPGFGYDGLEGLSFAKTAKKTLSIGINADERMERQMRRGFVGRLLLNAPKGAFRSAEEAKEFLENFKTKHASDQDGEDVGLLREGMTHEVVNMSNRDAEFIEARKFNRQEIALFMGLESILGDDSADSYNSLEQRNLGFLINTLMPWLIRWEEEANQKLLTDQQRAAGYMHKFNVGSLLRADTKTTLDTLAVGIQNRIWSPNEAREKLDENPYEGGDEYLNPNITPGAGAESSGDESETEESGSATSGATASSRSQKTAGRQLSSVEAVQKVYLGVGKMLTSDEARSLVNDETEAGLQVPGPQFSQQQTAQARVEHMLGVERKRVEQLQKANREKDIQKFYDTWESTLGDMIVNELGGCRSVAVDHVTKSRDNPNYDQKLRAMQIITQLKEKQ
jgi:HK97 family phage portal protein